MCAIIRWPKSGPFRRRSTRSAAPISCREPCASCERREIDFGGCRCQAFLLTGDARATDPVCHLSPASCAGGGACRGAGKRRLRLPSDVTANRYCPEFRLPAGGHLSDTCNQGRSVRCGAGHRPPASGQSFQIRGGVHVHVIVMPARLVGRRSLCVAGRMGGACGGPGASGLQPDRPDQGRAEQAGLQSQAASGPADRHAASTSCRSTRSSCRQASRPRSGRAAMRAPAPW